MRAIQDTITELTALNWEVIPGKMYAAFYADTPGGYVEIVDGELRGFTHAGSPLFKIGHPTIQQFSDELFAETGEQARVEQRIKDFLFGKPLWRSE